MTTFGCCLHLDREKLSALREAGYTCYEDALTRVADTPEEELKAFRDFADGLGMTCVSMNGMFPGELPLLTCAPEAIKAYLEKALPKAEILSPGVIVLGSGKARAIPEEMTREQAEDIFCERLKNVILPMCEQYGFRVAIEELRREECNFLHTCGEVMNIVRRVNRPSLGLLLDYYHAVLGGDTPDMMAECGSSIFHVHMASPINDRAFPTDMDTPAMKDFFAMLARIGYQGCVSLEGKAAGDFASSVREAIRVMKA